MQWVHRHENGDTGKENDLGGRHHHTMTLLE
ncbi:hypothetical protein Pecwa_3536 [Pectobacterium parmentieri WPP163]|nr:hypothetical protein Pecwa_3536 [Pectobacterium parmentieri WPP163]